MDAAENQQFRPEPEGLNAFLTEVRRRGWGFTFIGDVVFVEGYRVPLSTVAEDWNEALKTVEVFHVFSKRARRSSNYSQASSLEFDQGGTHISYKSG